MFATICFMLYFSSCSNSNQKSVKDNMQGNFTSKDDSIKHGKYLVEIMGCNDCHSPKKIDTNGPVVIPELMLSGYPSDRPIVKFGNNKMLKDGYNMFYPDLTAAAGPWGVSFAGNLTPDETGIGNWTLDQFKRAVTQGKYKGIENGRMLLPPMPWQDFTILTDEDVNLIFMYLKSIKPVRNIVPQPITPDKM
jgi:hypothetical protein